MLKQQRVLITGMGVINSIGNNIDAFTKSLKQGISGIDLLKRIPGEGTRIGASINNYSLEKALEENAEITQKIRIQKLMRNAPFSLRVGLGTVLEAWKMAKLDKDKIKPEEISLIIGGSNINQGYQFEIYQKYFSNPDYISPVFGFSFLDTDFIGTLSDIFGIKGEGYTIGGASASGNAAVINASRLIQLGRAKACIVVGALADLSPVEFNALDNLGAICTDKYQKTPKKASRPFDKESEGFVYGEGSACLILESFESAQKRKVPIFGEILSGAYVLDGNRYTNTDLSGEVRVMKKALKEAKVTSAQIDYINAHGTSAPLGDETEVNAIKKVFGSDSYKLNSTKSLIGHGIYSAGVMELIAVLIQMKEQFCHANLNLDHPIDKDIPFVNNKKAEKHTIKYALKNSFGFGGINTAVILKKIS